MSLSEQQILDLLQKHLKGDLTDVEKQCLAEEAERNRNIQSILHYLEFSPAESIQDPEIELIYENSRPNSLTETVPQDRVRKKSITIKNVFWRLVAVLAIVTFVWFALKKKENANPDEHWSVVKTERGERKFFRLIDGTQIWLNNESTLKVKEGYGKRNREIELIGEAYFDVAKNRDLPLHVHTKQTTIAVLGTIFNVRAYPDDKITEASLIEGKIKLQVKGDAKSDYTMVPGDRVVVSQAEGHSTINDFPTEAVDIQVYYRKMDLKNKDGADFKWTENQLVFNGDSLPVMLTKLSRWYNRIIILQSTDLEKEVFSGVFNEKECEQVLDILRKTGAKLNYETIRDTIYVK